MTYIPLFIWNSHLVISTASQDYHVENWTQDLFPTTYLHPVFSILRNGTSMYSVMQAWNVEAILNFYELSYPKHSPILQILSPNYYLNETSLSLLEMLNTIPLILSHSNGTFLVISLYTSTY